MTYNVVSHLHCICATLFQEQKKSFLAQVAAISNMSKAEVNELVEDAVAGNVAHCYKYSLFRKLLNIVWNATSAMPSS